MTGNLNMNNNRIYNIPAPNGPNQPTPLAYTDLVYLHVKGSNNMANDLNMNNKKINKLLTPTDDADAATKKYVDDNISNQNFSSYLKKDGSNKMTGHLNVSDAANKEYVDSHAVT